MAQETLRGHGERTQRGHKDTSGTQGHSRNEEGDTEGRVIKCVGTMWQQTNQVWILRLEIMQ